MALNSFVLVLVSETQNTNPYAPRPRREVGVTVVVVSVVVAANTAAFAAVRLFAIFFFSAKSAAEDSVTVDAAGVPVLFVLVVGRAATAVGFSLAGKSIRSPHTIKVCSSDITTR